MCGMSKEFNVASHIKSIGIFHISACKTHLKFEFDGVNLYAH